MHGEHPAGKDHPNGGLANSRRTVKIARMPHPTPRPYPHLAAWTFAALCATGAGAQTIQPVEDGLRPLYERIAAIQAELQELDRTLEESAALTEAHVIAEDQVRFLQQKKQCLEAQVLRAKEWSRSPLVMYAAPAGEQAPFPLDPPPAEQ